MKKLNSYLKTGATNILKYQKTQYGISPLINLHSITFLFEISFFKRGLQLVTIISITKLTYNFILIM